MQTMWKWVKFKRRKGEAGGRKHAAAGLACRRVTLSSFWESFMVSKGGRKKCRKSILFSKMNRWQSLSVEICFMSPSYVAALEMQASVLILFPFLQMLSYRITDTHTHTHNIQANEEWVLLCFALISPPLFHRHILLLSILPQTHAQSRNLYVTQLRNTIGGAGGVWVACSLGGCLKDEADW